MNESPETIRASLAHIYGALRNYHRIDSPLAARMHPQTRHALARMGYVRGCRLDVGEGWAIRVFCFRWCFPDEIEITLESAIRQSLARLRQLDRLRHKRRRKWRGRR